MRLTACLLVLSLVPVANAEEVVGWRSDGTGRYPDARPPVEFSADDGEGIAWRTELPGKSHSAPVLVGDRLFVTADPAHLLAVSAKDGEVLWSRSLDYEELFDADRLAEIEEAQAAAEKIDERSKALRRERGDLQRAGNLTEERKQAIEAELDALEKRSRELSFPPPKKGGSGNSTGTPTSDGERVFCLFATGIVTAHDLDGGRTWVASVGPAVDGFGHSASPLLVDDKLVVHTGNMTALDPATGETLWRAELDKRWGSPVAATIGDVPVVVTPSGAIVRAADGTVLARKLFDVGHATPIVENGIVYALGKESVAIRLPERIEGDTIEAATVWEVDGPRSRTFASALLHAGLIYNVDERGILEVFDATDGSRVYQERLPFEGGRAYSSVTLAGEYLFAGNDRGQVLVFRPGREYEQVAANELEGFSGAPIFAGTRMYVRGYQHLFAVGD